ncbi:uncharacterized protein LOC133188028 [Saccostrea echinata]|uniref:uncharacterized protein LOC133188028 n=1 Tax=Saccostrea echinata TaxID=191078 RepID=UPI002A80D231|nr:uncharacterized protein LOC133188028 [Saccostrea echinata]
MYDFVKLLIFVVLVSCVYGQTGNFVNRQGQTRSQNFGQSHPWEPSYKPSVDYTSHLLENHYNQLAQNQQKGIPPYQPKYSDQYGSGFSNQHQIGPGFTDQRLQQHKIHHQQVAIIPPPMNTYYNGPIGGFGFGGSGFDAPGIGFGVHHAPFYRPNVVSPMFVNYERPTFMDKVGHFVKSDAGKAIGAMAVGTLLAKAVNN